MAQKKYDLQWCQNYAKSRGGACLSNEYKGIHSALDYRCAENHIWSARPSKHIYEGSWCPECLSGKPVPKSEVCELVESQGFTLIGEFKGSNQKMLLLCPEGHKWSCTLTNFKRTKYGCPECSQVNNAFVRTKTRKYTITDIRNLATARLGSCLSLLDASPELLVTVAARGRFRCADGHEWETPFGTVVRGHWCPRCAFGKTKV